MAESLEVIATRLRRAYCVTGPVPNLHAFMVDLSNWLDQQARDTGMVYLRGSRIHRVRPDGSVTGFTIEKDCTQAEIDAAIVMMDEARKTATPLRFLDEHIQTKEQP